MKALVVIDVQNDFITGPLGSQWAQDVTPYIVDRVKEAIENGDKIFLTRDTHDEETYFHKLEGQKLPVFHCGYNTRGWDFPRALKEILIENSAEYTVFDKITFGSEALAQHIKGCGEPIEEIEICGFCTSICVLANAVLLRAAMPNMPIKVNGTLCADVNLDVHNAALKCMKAQQIDVYNGGLVTE